MPIAPADAESPTFDARIRSAEALYLVDPARAAQLAADALAEEGPHASPRQRACAARVRAHALGLQGHARQGLQELLAALDDLDAALPAARQLGPDGQRPLPGEGPASLPWLRCAVLHSLCMAHDSLGDLHEALVWGLKAVEAARELSDPLQLADILQSVGVVRARLGDHATALQHQLECLAVFDAAGDTRAMVSSLSNAGIAYKNLGRPAEAVSSLQRAIDVSRECGDEGMALRIGTNLSEPLRMLGRLDEALQAARLSQAHMQAAGMRDAEVHCLLQTGLSLQALGDLDGAQAEMEQALARAGSAGTGAAHHLPKVHRALYHLHKEAQRFEQALQHHEAYHAAERALFNEASTRSMNALQVRFDLERARHEADLERLRSAELAALSQTDALTGLANRRHLDQRLLEDTARAWRQQHPLAFAIIDVDNFKRVNDRHGHPVGDAVLKALATLLHQHCRSVDVCARYGGEEFCIVFVEARLDEAWRACEALRVAVAAHDWPALAAGLQVTLSIGLAELERAPLPTADQAPQQAVATLLATADHHLYCAKRDGKNRVLPVPGAASSLHRAVQEPLQA